MSIASKLSKLSLSDGARLPRPVRPVPPPPPPWERRPRPPSPPTVETACSRRRDVSSLESSDDRHASFKLSIAYEVTPPRKKGPTEAEKKLEALTRQIEREMETTLRSREESGDFFGVCHTCGEKVLCADDACEAMSHLFHTLCFTCCSCGRPLRGKAFYSVNGKVYCEEDYLYCGFHQTAERCAACGHLIVEMILQALGKSFHPGCFRCHHCQDCLDGVPFTVDVQNRVFCVDDYHALFAPRCHACGDAIVPLDGSDETVRVVSMEQSYHVDCYQCDTCHIQLTDGTCFPLDGRLLCRRCHESAAAGVTAVVDVDDEEADDRAARA